MPIISTSSLTLHDLNAIPWELSRDVAQLLVMRHLRGRTARPVGDAIEDLLENEELPSQLTSPRSTEPFVPGHTLRFAPTNVHIRLDPAKGYNFSGPSIEAPPILPTPTQCPQFKVGITIDGTPPKQIFHEGTDSITEIYNPNEPVFFKVTLSHPWYELRDSLGRCVVEDVVRFDPCFQSLDSRLAEARRLGLQEQERHDKELEKHYDDMREWRIFRRLWEIELLETEFRRGNLSIFPPDITWGKIKAAVRELYRQILEERQTETKSLSSGRIKPRFIHCDQSQYSSIVTSRDDRAAMQPPSDEDPTARFVRLQQDQVSPLDQSSRTLSERPDLESDAREIQGEMYAIEQEYSEVDNPGYMDSYTC
ncbi:hypothetical protein AJ80_03264 [Polytolypa hystricis UAMH7299]|uniref:Uncharacterized protein n=1 Tax=Polytolypa hystricis (strain UAMH7299) TaxID=1447883 RepID=A0A2B7YKD9_POLH7|nr:hypothetical protein AJ80_03264 [Polytolypa hystricis UAMH7299]